MDNTSTQIDARALPRLKKFVELLREWNSVTDLISEDGLSNVWSRHIADCAELLELAPNAKRWLDIGSGGGFPSVVIACQLADVQDVKISSVDSDARKCVFLREVARRLELPLHVYNRRAETLSSSEIGHVDVVTSRAFASLSKIMLIAEPFLGKGAIAILPRGETARAELDEIDDSWYSVERIPSTSGRGVIFRVEKRKPANRYDPN